MHLLEDVQCGPSINLAEKEFGGTDKEDHENDESESPVMDTL